MKKLYALSLLALLTGSYIIAQTTATFNYTGAAQTFTVPACVYNIDVDVRGGKGGNANSVTAGNGGKVTATIAVTPGQVLQINVGGLGGSPAGGWNGGGNGNAGFAPGGNSGGGGGASDIRIAPNAMANRIVVAGGGGGAAGGSSSGSWSASVVGGAGGGANGVDGLGSWYTGTGGTGGTQTAGGNGGPPWGGGGSWGTNGSLGQGGNGGMWGDASGGGGGGGFYGGGGGGSDGCCSGANGGAGGGGGSSLTPGGGVTTANVNAGAGIITITYVGGAAAVTAANTGPYCAGATIDLTTPAGGVTYAWTGPLGFSSAVQNPSIASSTVAMSGVYTVTVDMGGGCMGTSTTTVTVNPAQATPTPTNTGPYCTGNTIQLNSPTGSATDDWAGPAGYTATNNQNPTIASSTPAMTGLYTVTVTNAFSCSATATTNVVVNTLPPATASNTGPYCEGDVVDVASTGGTDYDWTGPGGFVLNNTQNVTIPAAVIAMNGTYTVTVTDANNCSATASTALVVNLMPIPVANNTGPYCAGDPINLSSGGGSTYAWSGPVAYTSAAQNPVIASATVAMAGDYTVTVTTALGCSDTKTTTVIVSALPVPTASNTGPYCEGDRIDLIATGGVSYSWSGPLGFASASQNPSINSSVQTQTGTYTVTVTTGPGCVSTSNTVVDVHPTPTAVPLFTPDNPTTLKPEVNFFDASYANISTWNWDIDTMIYNTSSFTHTFTTAGNFVGVLTVTTVWGCSDTAVFSVYVKPEIAIYIPNTFTPNGDGVNDIFYAYGTNWSRIEFTIFDRWGSMIFNTNDAEKGWDGSINNMGDTVMQGIYVYKVYIIDFYGKEHSVMGHVNLIR